MAIGTATRTSPEHGDRIVTDARAALEEQLHEEGRLWTQNPQRLREVLAEGCARARIPTLSPHALRHTFGTRWLQAGGDIYKLSKILGHSSVGVTEAHYAHLLKDDLVAASQQVRIPVAPRGRGTWSGCRGAGPRLRLDGSRHRLERAPLS